MYLLPTMSSDNISEVVVSGLAIAADLTATLKRRDVLLRYSEHMDQLDKLSDDMETAMERAELARKALTAAETEQALIQSRLDECDRNEEFRDIKTESAALIELEEVRKRAGKLMADLNMWYIRAFNKDHTAAVVIDPNDVNDQLQAATQHHNVPNTDIPQAEDDANTSEPAAVTMMQRDPKCLHHVKCRCNEMIHAAAAVPADQAAIVATLQRSPKCLHHVNCQCTERILAALSKASPKLSTDNSTADDAQNTAPQRDDPTQSRHCNCGYCNPRH